MATLIVRIQMGPDVQMGALIYSKDEVLKALDAVVGHTDPSISDCELENLMRQAIECDGSLADNYEVVED